MQYINQFMSIDNKQINTFSILFKDNNGTLQLDTESKYYLRTKYIYIKYHYYYQYVKNKTISIRVIDALE